MEIMQNKVFLGAILVCGIVWGINGYIAIHRAPVLLKKIASQTFQTPTTPVPISTAGWKTYQNEEYGFNFKYTSDLKLVESFDLCDEKNDNLDLYDKDTRVLTIQAGERCLAGLDSGEILKVSYINDLTIIKWVDNTNTQEIISTIKVGSVPISTATWKLYSGNYPFKIELPPDWRDTFPQYAASGPWTFQTGVSGHGVGVPPSGNMWINISKVDGLKTFCNGTTIGYEPFNYFNDSEMERTVCTANFQIILGLWKSDPQFNEHEALLDKIAQTFNSAE